MKMEQAWVPDKDRPLKPEMTAVEKRRLLEARHTFENLLNVLPKKTPEDLKRERVYLDTLQKIKDMAQKLEYYDAYGQG